MAIEAVFRMAAPADALCLGVLATQVFLDTYATSGIRPTIAREVNEQLSTSAVATLLADAKYRFIMAEAAGHLIGFVQLQLGVVIDAAPDAAKVARLYVQERFAGQGIGTQLLARAERLAVSHGARRAWLTVWTGNARALAFYPRRGYRDAGPTTYTFEGEQYENRLFVKQLAAAAPELADDTLPRSGSLVALRRFRLEDLPPFAAYRSDPAVARYQGWSPLREDEARDFLLEMRAAPLLERGAWTQLAIAGVGTVAGRSSDELLGDVGLFVASDASFAEIGISLARAAQHRGVATEALVLALRLLFDATPVAHALAITDARNAACIRLLERAGFRRRSARDTVFRGEPCVEYVYVAERGVL